MSAVTTKSNKQEKKGGKLKAILAQWQLLMMSVPMFLYIIVFAYVPLLGWVMAFQNFRPRVGANIFQQVATSEWVGFGHFITLLDTSALIGQRFMRAVVNTLGQSILSLALGFFFTILLSLMLNEVRQIGVKRIIQNFLYLPHFLSWVIVAGLVSTALALPDSGGFINNALLAVGIIHEPIHFLANPNYFWGIVAGSMLWKNLGWNTIIYMAAMTAIDPALYEAASIDGANRYHKAWHVTLPSIRSTIVILLIMNVGWLLTSGFEIQWFLGHGVNITRSENIDIFVLRYGLEMNNFGLATAAGILRTGVAILMLTAANFIAKLLGQETLF